MQIPLWDIAGEYPFLLSGAGIAPILLILVAQALPAAWEMPYRPRNLSLRLAQALGAFLYPALLILLHFRASRPPQ